MFVTHTWHSYHALKKKRPVWCEEICSPTLLHYTLLYFHIVLSRYLYIVNMHMYKFNEMLILNICSHFIDSMTTSDAMTTILSTIPTTVNPLCVDHDSRCTLYKNKLCAASNQDFVVARCARTCNKCPEYLGKYLQFRF